MHNFCSATSDALLSQLDKLLHISDFEIMQRRLDPLASATISICLEFPAVFLTLPFDYLLDLSRNDCWHLTHFVELFPPIHLWKTGAILLAGQHPPPPSALPSLSGGGFPMGGTLFSSFSLSAPTVEEKGRSRLLHCPPGAHNVSSANQLLVLQALSLELVKQRCSEHLKARQLRVLQSASARLFLVGDLGCGFCCIASVTLLVPVFQALLSKFPWIL
ncbi:hypothetical protein P7K49_028382 [Saguinus oedipus]|uniref:Uncharacterized protein n=1 Tax=Saguinus oedipus TaxID=9490 RepID=A0ABQ9UCV3_SAGOE|nr:hypothetical protein P7K49_028382 [Saguinus oedipus]